MSLTPIKNKILVRRQENEKVSPGGIILPENAKEAPAMGTVVSIGNEIKEDIKVNDQLIFGKFAGQDVEIDGQKLLMIKETDVLAVVYP